jgi:CRP/FNR family transcriptional regulator, anaerobic regulatory protein
MKELLTFIRLFQPLDEDTEKAVCHFFNEETYLKNKFLAEEGSVCSKIYFIKSGLVRRFYLRDGEEMTKWLYHDNHWTAIMSSYFNQKPSLEYLQACEDTVVYSLLYDDEKRLLEYPLFFKFYAQFFRYSLANFDEFHFVFGSFTTQQKYQYLIDKFPVMIQKAKQKHIASLLNVSQETLSRVRALNN